MRLGRDLREERGTAAVELALTMPVFLMLLLGAIEYGLVMWTQFGIEHGAEMAARCAVISPSQCPNVPIFAASEAFGLNPPASTFTVSTPACGEEVSASYKFNFVTKYFGKSVTLSAMSCFPK